jgi:hypothetical protein
MEEKSCRSVEMRKGVPILVILFGMLICGLGMVSPGWGQPFLLDGNHWSQISYDAKVAYVKGVGNMADFEVQAGGSKSSRGYCLAYALVQEMKGKTIEANVLDVDQYYKENPGDLKKSVLEVMLRRAAKVCPPETKK